MLAIGYIRLMLTCASQALYKNTWYVFRMQIAVHMYVTARSGVAFYLTSYVIILLSYYLIIIVTCVHPIILLPLSYYLTIFNLPLSYYHLTKEFV